MCRVISLKFDVANGFVSSSICLFKVIRRLKLRGLVVNLIKTKLVSGKHLDKSAEKEKRKELLETKKK